MFRVWQTVQPFAVDHPRAGQAGVVHATDPKKADEVVVKWDDGVIEAVAVVELRALSS